MPSKQLDDALKCQYVAFAEPADEIVRKPHLTKQFCELIRNSQPELSSVADDEITHRLLSLRKKGQDNGGLPRLRH